jgi:hypothetical protein
MMKSVRALGLPLLLALLAAPVSAAARPGRIAGVVVDPQGAPQMGATIDVSPEGVLAGESSRLLTNERGIFATDGLAAGWYSIRATLAGFMPTIEQHIRVTDTHITQIQIELGSIFSSVDKLRRPSGEQTAPDDWTWVLRTSAATRPILRWDDDDVSIEQQLSHAETAQNQQMHSLLELTSGSLNPASISNTPDTAATGFAYDENLGEQGHLVFAGEFGYDSASANGGFVAQWVPSGSPHSGPVSTLVIRESQLDPQGPGFRGVRLSHDNQLDLGDRVHLRYGADFVAAGYLSTATSLRPGAQAAIQLAPNWLASAEITERSWQNSDSNDNLLASAYANLDSLPTLMLNNGHAVLAGDTHAEIAMEHTLDPSRSVSVAVFHDHSRDTSIMGRGAGGPDFLQAFYSNAFAYDGGASSSWGMRVAYEQKLSDNASLVLLFSRAGALMTPGSDGSSALRDTLETTEHNSLAARVKGHIPRTGTEFVAGYKWIDGPVVSRLDPYGEAEYSLDPYFSLAVRQKLPHFIPGHATAMADFSNLLAQGYVPFETQDGQVILVPSFRSFRGGLSFQF